MIGYCDACHTDEIQVSEYPKGILANQEKVNLCFLCATTSIGGLATSPYQRGSNDVMRAIGQVGNIILKEIRSLRAQPNTQSKETT